MALTFCKEGVGRISQPLNLKISLVDDAVVPATDPENFSSYTEVQFSGYSSGDAVASAPVPTNTGWYWNFGVDIFVHNGGAVSDTANGVVYYLTDSSVTTSNVAFHADIPPILFDSIGDNGIFIGKISVNGTP
jgi:hypothetical protein